MKKNIDLTDFTYLLLATLAKNSKHASDNTKTAVLPLYYKDVIERILCNPNRWKYMLSVLIDTDEYFKNHFLWENKFSRELNTIVNKLNKKMKLNLEFDEILIEFSNDEIKEILDRYDNVGDEVKARIEHFSNLLNANIFTRRFTEEFHRHINYTDLNLKEIDKYNEKEEVEEVKKEKKRKVRNIRFL